MLCLTNQVIVVGRFIRQQEIKDLGNKRQTQKHKAPANVYFGDIGDDIPFINVLNHIKRKPVEEFVNLGKCKGTKEPKTRTIPPTSTAQVENSGRTGPVGKQGLPQSQQQGPSLDPR
jgi:hypothetical protein